MILRVHLTSNYHVLRIHWSAAVELLGIKKLLPQYYFEQISVTAAIERDEVTNRPEYFART